MYVCVNYIKCYHEKITDSFLETICKLATKKKYLNKKKGSSTHLSINSKYLNFNEQKEKKKTTYQHFKFL